MPPRTGGGDVSGEDTAPGYERVAVIGMDSVEELDRNIEWARHWQPLTAEEEAQLLEEGRRIARSWGDHYGDLL